MAKKVAVLIGSLRKDSFNRKIGMAMKKMAPPELSLELVEIGALPLYNPDDEQSAPAPWTEFRAKINSMQAVLFITAEYNRSVPSALKNAIDVGSRPYGKSVWSKKPAGIISSSPGAIGGFGANHHLRQSLVFLDMPTLQQPEAYISGADKLFDDAGEFTNPSTKEFLSKYLQTFQAWIERNAAA